MNISEYMKNPLGKGASVLMLSTTRKALDDEYATIAAQITHKWYNLNNKYYIIHIKIPSKSISQLYYDVLLEFDADSIPKQVTVINNGKCRVFSNCPSFTFTFAYVFNKNKDIIPWTKKKYNSLVFKSNPAKRNPAEIRNYEKSLYFAIKYITTNGRNYIAGINMNVNRIHSYYQILNNLQSSDDITNAYHSKKNAEKTSSKNILKNEKNKSASLLTNAQSKSKKGAASKTKTVTISKKVSSTRKIKKI